MTETPASGQELDDVTPVLVAEKYPVYLNRPTDGQMTALVLLAGIDSQDDLSTVASLISGLSEVMDSLCVPPEDTDDKDATTIRHLYKLMCRGAIELEDYLAPAVALAERWGSGQVEQSRAERRAAKKVPAKTAVARPGRTRR